MKLDLIHGDCLEKMADIPDGTVDMVLTDPPYELGFMGKSWDNTGIANNPKIWAECLRVLKPGGHLLSFGGTRTYHRMASAIEDAGFEVRDMIEWVTGSGFPKSLNIGKTVDKLQGNEREDLGEKTSSSYPDSDGVAYYKNRKRSEGSQVSTGGMPRITKGTSEWEGWGTALKPAHEPICVARKPLAEKTVAENVLKYGTGGINIEESRVGTDGGETHKGGFQKQYVGNKVDYDNHGVETDLTPKGRFPANLIHDNSDEVRECFPNESERFFKSIIYQAKSSKSDRNSGGVVKNVHPTCKPVALMEYLTNMYSRNGATILDPFMGSGTTGIACRKLNRNFIGIELDETYFEIAKKRIENSPVLLPL